MKIAPYKLSSARYYKVRESVNRVVGMNHDMSAVALLRQNLVLLRLACSFRTVELEGGPTGSGGPEVRRKSARSLVAERAAEASVLALAARACSLGLNGRGASLVTVEEMLAG